MPTKPLVPVQDYPPGERVAVQVGKTPYVRFELNDYSVPHTHVRRTLAVLADQLRVRVFDGVAEIASHARSYDAGAQIEDAAHAQALVQHKRQARGHRGVDRVSHAVPAASKLLAQAVERGETRSAFRASPASEIRTFL